MIECEISKIMVDEQSHEQMVVLKEVHGERNLPIIIGIAEVSAIRAKFTEHKPIRPISYDLLKSIIVCVGANIEHMLIDEYKEGIFYAKIILKDSSGKEHIIDARPSDCIALSVRISFPIFVKDHLLEIASQTT